LQRAGGGRCSIVPRETNMGPVRTISVSRFGWLCTDAKWPPRSGCEDGGWPPRLASRAARYACFLLRPPGPPVTLALQCGSVLGSSVGDPDGGLIGVVCPSGPNAVGYGLHVWNGTVARWEGDGEPGE